MTDELDPFFYYYMDVGEQDFHHFKRDQHILVDFNVFPLKMIELIQLCLQSNASDSSGAINGILWFSEAFVTNG